MVEIERWRASDPARISWEGPATFDAQTISEITSSSLMTPYRALSMAVRNEERAFAFWSYVAAHAGQGELKRAAETMARQELEHVAKLRKERRRAYHEERRRERLSGDAITSAEIDAGIWKQGSRCTWRSLLQILRVGPPIALASY